MSLSPFSPTSYYRFSNAAYPNTGISTGYKYENTPPHLGLTPFGSRSSENWQIYRQRDASGRSVYFIRNYDYGAALQLGLTEQVRAVPRLLPRSGELGQQWMLKRDEKGGFVLTNVLLGNGSYLGVSGGGNSGLYTREVPAMQPSPDGSERWTVTINVSAGEITAQDGLTDIELMQIPASTLPLLPFYTTAPASLKTVCPPATPAGAVFVNIMNGMTAVLFFVGFVCIAVLAYCKGKRKHGYQRVAAVEDEKNEGEGLPLYGEKGAVEGKTSEIAQGGR